jgi:hypothetical protein
MKDRSVLKTSQSSATGYVGESNSGWTVNTGISIGADSPENLTRTESKTKATDLKSEGHGGLFSTPPATKVKEAV